MKKTGKAIFMSSLSAVLFIFLLNISFAEDLKTDRMSGQNASGISFNFIDVEIPTVIRFISKITGNNFVFDEKIKGKITIVAPTKLTIEESFTLFTSVLNMKGYTIIPAGKKTYTIVPSSQAKQSGEIPTGEDMPINERFITRILTLEHINANEALKFLRPVVSRNGHLSVFGPRNLLLIVDSAINIEKVSSILKSIDLPPTHEEASMINVYFVENADATELAEVLNGMIKSTRAAKQTSARDKNKPLIDSVSRISITPDKATNSLIIVALPSDYENILEVIKTLDKRRKQVFVEAMIIEASLDGLKAIGSKWRAIARRNGEPMVIGGVGQVSAATMTSIINGLSGFSAGGMGNFFTIPGTLLGSDDDLTVPGFAALFSFSDFEDVINILSTPQILTSDNEEAEIIVGQNVPFISNRETNASTGETLSTSIERQDVGIKLKITPHITEGDYVKLDIYQEISSIKDTVKDTSENTFIITTVGPTTTKRSTRTSVVVKDSHTVVISGLMQETEEESITKTPLLGDIPLLGWFFKHKEITKTKTNLLLFLTPHIIHETSQLADITRTKYRAFAMEEKQYIKDELLVRFKSDVSGERAEAIIAQHEATVINTIKDLNIYHIKLRKGQEVEAAIDEFSSHPEVLYAEPNFKIKIQSDSSDNIRTPSAPKTSPEKKARTLKLFGPYHPQLSGLNRR